MHQRHVLGKPFHEVAEGKLSDIMGAPATAKFGFSELHLGHFDTKKINNGQDLFFLDRLLLEVDLLLPDHLIDSFLDRLYRIICVVNM